jgi:hypothetical protein
LTEAVGYPHYPDDGVPYRDYDTPDISNTYRDASAAAILTSALYEISTCSTTKDYKAWYGQHYEYPCKSGVQSRRR